MKLRGVTREDPGFVGGYCGVVASGRELVPKALAIRAGPSRTLIRLSARCVGQIFVLRSWRSR
jgi:hypothetical protein